MDDTSGTMVRVHQYYYRTRQQTTTTANLLAVEAEIPGGVIDGTNRVFTLVNTPASAENLAPIATLFKNGSRMDYPASWTISGNHITYAVGIQPQVGDTHQIDYMFQAP